MYVNFVSNIIFTNVCKKRASIVYVCFHSHCLSHYSIINNIDVSVEITTISIVETTTLSQTSMRLSQSLSILILISIKK